MHENFKNFTLRAMHNKLRKSSGNSGDQMKSNDVNDLKRSTIFKNKTNVFRFDSVITEKRAVQKRFVRCFSSAAWRYRALRYSPANLRAWKALISCLTSSPPKKTVIFAQFTGNTLGIMHRNCFVWSVCRVQKLYGYILRKTSLNFALLHFAPQELLTQGKKKEYDWA